MAARVLVAAITGPAGAVFVTILAVGGGKALHIIEGAAAGEVQERVADDLAAPVEAEQHVATDEFPLDPNKDRGIILLALLGIP